MPVDFSEALSDKEYISPVKYVFSFVYICHVTLFANSNGLVQRHSSSRGYTIHSIVQFLQSASANLSELRKSYTELEDQHAQDIESLMEDKESAVDEKETEVRDAKEEGQQWKNKYDELSSKHQSCEAVAQERDQLKEKETEFDTAIKRTAQLETDLQPLREEVERLKEDVEQEKSLRVKAEQDLAKEKSKQTPLERDLEGFQGKLEEYLHDYEEEKTAREEAEQQTSDIKVEMQGLQENNTDLTALSKQLVECYINRSQANLVHYYADRDLDNGYDLYALIAEQIGVRVNNAPTDPLSRAIVLERAIMTRLINAPSVVAATVVFRQALKLAALVNFPSNAFLSLCAVFETLHKWFPYANATDYTTLMETVLDRRYLALQPGELPPLLDQVCIYHLGLTLPSPSDKFQLYSAGVHNALTDITINSEH
ncbi:unnamed protein product [Zymoseptoria tritici ST99CH_1A5]|uniref:Uncharacterized protein n=1 Tax=Zymoseptoria tritici ST99CH_1A5 TaxID=1276529 RepID=A0A1Y6LWI9_ZYMTR|nr:unnamed protein product [Zymoseptoria tritici ST99CH_1A5]